MHTSESFLAVHLAVRQVNAGLFCSLGWCHVPPMGWKIDSGSVNPLRLN